MAPKTSPNQNKKKQAGLVPTALTGVIFQRQVRDLWKHTKGKPQDPVVYPIPQQHEDSGRGQLPLAVEIELSEGFAYIAAVKKGVESVSASAVGFPNNESDGLIVYVASNDGVLEDTQGHLRSIVQTLQRVACREISKTVCRELVLATVLGMNSGRINARLKARRKNTPIVFQGLRQILASLVNIDHGAGNFAILRSRLTDLCHSLQSYSVTAKSSIGIRNLRTLVLACRHFWAAPGGEATRDMLVRAGIDINEMRGNSCLLQIAKIAAYDHICRMMVAHASDRRLEGLFKHVTLHCVPAHNAIQTTIPASIAGGGNQCRVHAEVQLTIALDTTRMTKWKRPRTIGSSKAACFLCDLFMQKHGKFLVPRTHGLLTPFWALPNSDRFTAAQRHHYQRIVTAMGEELLKLTMIPHPHRFDPAMSWQALSRLRMQYDSQRSSRRPTPALSVQSLGVPSVISHAMEQHSPSLQPLASLGNDSLKLRPVEQMDVPVSRESVAVDGAPCVTRENVSTDVIQTSDSASASLRSDALGRPESPPSLQNKLRPCNPVNDSVNDFKSGVVLGRSDVASLSQDTRNIDILLDTSDRESYEDRTCDTAHHTDMPSMSQPTRCVNVTRITDNSCHRIDLHDLELFVEAESPATVFVTVQPHPTDRLSKTTPVVDVESLQPGNELVVVVVVDAATNDSGPDRRHDLLLAMRHTSGMGHQWAIRWELD